MREILQIAIFLVIFVSVFGSNDRTDDVINAHIRSKRNPANSTDTRSYKFSKSENIDLVGGCKECQECLKDTDCVETTTNGSVCMVTKCPADFYDPRIAHHCHTDNLTEILLDFRLSLPVTNTAKGITYRNVFCAYCNDERHYEFWKIFIHFEDISSWDDYELTELFKTPLRLHENGQYLIFNNTNTTALIYGGANNSWKGLDLLRRCKNTNFNDSFKDDIDFPFNHLILPQFYNYASTEAFIYHDKIYFQFKLSTQDSSPKEEFVFPAADREICVHNFYRNKKTDVNYGNNGNITINDLNLTFELNKWCETFNEEQISACTTSKMQSVVVRNFVVLSILRTLSAIFFLTLIITVGTNKKKRQKLPNKIVLSYSLTVLTFQVLTNASFWLSSCKVMGPLLYYLSLCHYVWLSILAFEFWRMIYHSTNVHKDVARRPHTRKFFIYCTIGWISPLSLLSIAMYLESLTKCGDNISCKLRPTFGKYLTCYMTGEEAIWYFLNWPIIVTSCLIVISFLHSTYNVYLINNLGCFEKKENFMLIVKLAMTLGLGFIVLLFSNYFEDVTVKAMTNILEQSQGIILYFIHGYDKETINTIYNKYVTRKTTKNIDDPAPAATAATENNGLSLTTI